jgi:hypothetical protein
LGVDLPHAETTTASAPATAKTRQAELRRPRWFLIRLLLLT